MEFDWNPKIDIDYNKVQSDFDLTSVKKSEDLLQFLKIYTHYLNMRRGYIVTTQTQQKFFSIIRPSLVKVAKSGNNKAIAFYLLHETPEKIDPEILQLAKQIESKEGNKTPEEWEVIASIYASKPIICYYNSTTYTADTLFKTVTYLKNYICFVTDEQSRGRRRNEDLAKKRYEFNYFTDRMNNNEDGNRYLTALITAKVGYLERFSRHKDPLDLCYFYELNNLSLSIFQDNIKYWQACSDKIIGCDSANELFAKAFRRNKKESHPCPFVNFAYARGSELTAGYGEEYETVVLSRKKQNDVNMVFAGLSAGKFDFIADKSKETTK